MNFKRIDRWSFRYHLIRSFVSFIHNNIFYRNVCVTGKENIPENTPVFFAPNHQNALMDALAILCNVKQQAVFIARADIFKNSLIARILILFKILPAYRIRDGKESLRKNEEIFDISVKILENKNILALFPETTHTDLRHLKELKKGVQRIVFQAEEKNDYKLGVKIVPIGIYFSNYWNFQSDVHINFGKPMEIDEYLEIYKINPQKAMLALRDKIAENLIPLIIHIEHLEYYQLFEFMRDFFNTKMLQKLELKKCPENKFIADQKTIEILDSIYQNKPEIISELDNQAKKYQNLLKNSNIRHWVVEKNEHLGIISMKVFALLFSLPVFLYGFINNLIPSYLPKLVTKKLKDRQFTSSINFVIGLISFPLFYLLQFCMVWIFTETWWIKFVYLASLPIIGIIAFKIHRFFIKLKSQIKFLSIKSRIEGKNMIELNNKINSTFEPLADWYMKN